MDLEEIKLHAQTWLASNDYHQYTLATIIQTEGIDVWEVNVDVVDGELCLLLSDSNGAIIDFTKRRHFYRSLTDSLTITDAISTTMSMYFELSTKLNVGTNRSFVGRIEINS